MSDWPAPWAVSDEQRAVLRALAERHDRLVLRYDGLLKVDCFGGPAEGIEGAEWHVGQWVLFEDGTTSPALNAVAPVPN